MAMTKPAPSFSARKTDLLAVSGNEADLGWLRTLFAGSSWELRTARTLAEAGEWLRQNQAPVVLCETRLPDGDWKALLRMANDLSDPPNVVVTSRDADAALWAEALNRGAFDVLPSPATHSEIFGTLSSAWRNWNDRRRKCRGTALCAPACAG